MHRSQDTHEQESEMNYSLPSTTDFRNPRLKWRIALVAGVLTLPGFVAGAMASLFFGNFALCTLAGVVLGAGLGVAIENWPLFGSHRD